MSTTSTVERSDFSREFNQSINPSQAEFDRLIRLRFIRAAEANASVEPAFHPSVGSSGLPRDASVR
jgi:hypothetical protein